MSAEKHLRMRRNSPSEVAAKARTGKTRKRLTGDNDPGQLVKGTCNAADDKPGGLADRGGDPGLSSLLWIP